MIRRIVKSPAQCSHNLVKRKSRISLDLEGRYRYITGDNAFRTQQLDCEPSSKASSALTPRYTANVPSSRRTFELHGISTRDLSSETIQATSPRDIHNFFGGSTSVDSYMLNPFLGSEDSNSSSSSRVVENNKDSIAYLELYKAISTVNHQYADVPTELSFLEADGNDSMKDFIIEGEKKKQAVEVVEHYEETSCNTTAAHGEEDAAKTEEIQSSSMAFESHKGEEVNIQIAEEDVNMSKESLMKKTKKSNKSTGIKLERQKLHSELTSLRNTHRDNPSKLFGALMELFETSRHLMNRSQLLSIFYVAIDAELDLSNNNNKQVNYSHAEEYNIGRSLQSAFVVLKYHEERSMEEEGGIISLNLYLKLFQKLASTKLDYRRFDARGMAPYELELFVQDIVSHIQKEYCQGTTKIIYQHILLPELVSALVENWDRTIKACAKPIMDHILDCEFPLFNPDLFEHMLGRAKKPRERENAMPYHKMLAKLVLDGHRPKPETVMNVLNCYLPFNDLRATQETLASIRELQNPHEYFSDSEDYRVDLGTLEAISMAAARRSVDLNLLVWDFVEQYGYNPTESMFEDVIMSFVATRQDNNVYSALADMEKAGFVPSQSLLRYVALQLSAPKRQDTKRLDHSSRLLSYHQNTHMRSTPALNAILLGYGIKRDINSAFLVFEDFRLLNLRRDDNTYTFLMESLYMDIKNRFPHQHDNCNPEEVSQVLEAAQIILDSMEEEEISTSKRFVHEYIRVLCSVGLFEDATAAIKEFISSGAQLQVSTLFVLATKLAEAGNFEGAYAVAALSEAAGCGKNHRLVYRIKNIETPKRSKGRRRDRDTTETPTTNIGED